MNMMSSIGIGGMMGYGCGAAGYNYNRRIDDGGRLGNLARLNESNFGASIRMTGNLSGGLQTKTGGELARRERGALF